MVWRCRRRSLQRPRALPIEPRLELADGNQLLSTTANQAELERDVLGEEVGLLVNPTTNLRLPIADSRRERAASPREVRELLNALPPDLQALWATAALGGLRRGELRALRVADVDFPAVTAIRVSRGWDEVEGPIEPKSQEGRRTVPVASALRRYLLEQKIRTGRDGDELLFGRTATEPFTPTHVRMRALATWAAANARREREGLPALEPLGLHEARHTFSR